MPSKPKNMLNPEIAALNDVNSSLCRGYGKLTNKTPGWESL